MKRFRIEMPYEGKRIMEVSANSEEEALKIFREKNSEERNEDPVFYMDSVIELEEGRGDIVKLGDLKEEFISMCEVYEAEHGVKPRFADVRIRFKGETDDHSDVVCFDPTYEFEEGSPEDNLVTMHYNGVNPVDDMFRDGEIEIVSVEDVMFEL